MSILLVVNSPERWPLHIPGVELVPARSYLTDPSFSERRGLKLFNLCRSYGYQSEGYYVSLLAEARGHRPQPSVETIQGMKNQAMVRIVSEDVGELVRRSLAPVRSDEYVLSIYFGRSLAQRNQRLALSLFNQFQAPLLRARFRRDAVEGWELTGIRPIPNNEIPESHLPFVVEAAEEYFKGRRFSPRRSRSARYDLAILHDPQEEYPPSNQRALQRFVRAAESVGLEAELITKDDYGHLSEFDALFIRTTTAVDHYTYRFASRAEASGMVVIDDPQSIVRAANKVFQAEVLARHGVPIPRTMIVHRDNVALVAEELGLPCVLKQPDSAFSQGVSKVSTHGRAGGGLRSAAGGVGAGRRAGLRADRVRLARGRVRRQAALCLPLLHGARPLADHQGGRQRGRLRPRRNSGGRAGAQGRRARRGARSEPDRRRLVRRRHQAARTHVLRDRGQRQPQHRRRIRGPRAEARALPAHHGGHRGPHRAAQGAARATLSAEEPSAEPSNPAASGTREPRLGRFASGTTWHSQAS
jgi:hypothetical protein